MRRAALALGALLLVAATVALWLSRPQPLPEQAFAALAPGDPGRGEAVFHAGGCASCHAAEGASGDARLVLAGGQAFASDFGTFRAPNISPGVTHGIGGWSLSEFGNAMLRGVAPDGRHYYPAFPYTAYALADPQDIADLHAWLATLPPDATPNQPHELSFPYNLRRGVGLWKARYMGRGWAVTGDLAQDVARGRYLVEALGHCAECHTPRDALGGLDRARWLAGAANPSGDGRVPGITPAQLGWGLDEIATYLETGFTPGFDVAGGKMVAVVDSLAHLPQDDLRAIAAYLLAVPDAPQ
jgi:mono/diheme cytochrome c family protein